MFPVENLKIALWNELDITSIVTRVNISESIHGDLTGSLSIEDGVNLIHKAITVRTPILISYTYLGQDVIILFTCDGITNVSIENNIKKYQVHFGSINELAKSNTIISESFSDTLSTSIIKKVFDTIGIDNLNINTESSTSGKYIAPNVSSSEVIKTVLNNAYDDEQSGFFLFQKLKDNGQTTLESLAKILKNKVKDVIIKQKAITLEDLNPIGTSNEFLVVEDDDSMINKIKLGMFGIILNQLNLNETTSTVISTDSGGGVTSTNMLVINNNNRYDNGSQPLLKYDKTVGSANEEKAKLFNKNLKITNVVSLPFIGVGGVIEVEHGASNIEFEKRYSGDWVISGIEHKYTKANDGTMIYKQDYNLVRK